MLGDCLLFAETSYFLPNLSGLETESGLVTKHLHRVGGS